MEKNETIEKIENFLRKHSFCIPYKKSNGCFGWKNSIKVDSKNYLICLMKCIDYLAGNYQYAKNFRKKLNLSDYKVCNTNETELSTNSADVCGREKNPAKRKGDVIC